MLGRFSSGIGLEISRRLGDNAASMRGKLLKLLSAIVVALALSFPFLLALAKISESDTFWHLKTGEWIVSHGAIPRVDPFSATVNGKPWLDWEWLFQVGIYVLYAWAGFKALVVGKAVIVFLTGVVLFLACRQNGARVALARFRGDGSICRGAGTARSAPGRVDAFVRGGDGGGARIGSSWKTARAALVARYWSWFGRMYTPRFRWDSRSWRCTALWAGLSLRCKKNGDAC